jgi:SPOR domain
MADDTYSRGPRKDPYGRGGTPGQATDPLTELARLIGQSDPFAPEAAHDRRPAAGADPRASQPEWRNHPPPADPPYEHGRDGGFSAMAEPKLDPALYEDSGYRSGTAQAPGDALYDQGYGEARSHDHEAPYFGATEHAQGQDDGYYDDAPGGPRRRGGLITAAALLGLAVIGTAGAFAYRAVFTSSGPPSIIARDAGPNKIVPATQTADNSSNKQIYDRAGDRSQNERIVPREEQPLNLPDPARAAAPRALGQNSAAAIPGMPGGGPARPGVAPDTSAVAPTGPGGEPKKIRTVTIKSEQPPLDPAPTRPAAPPRAAPAASPNAPLSLSPQSGPQNSPQSGTAAPPPPPARAAAVAPPPSAAANANSAAGYFVQVAAQKSQEEAQASYRGIQTKYASVLGGREPVIRRKDLGSKGVFYGAQVGPFSREDAVQLCNSLKSAGATCMIQKN